jgi:hypothetical protein
MLRTTSTAPGGKTSICADWCVVVLLCRSINTMEKRQLAMIGRPNTHAVACFSSCYAGCMLSIMRQHVCDVPADNLHCICSGSSHTLCGYCSRPMHTFCMQNLTCNGLFTTRCALPCVCLPAAVSSYPYLNQPPACECSNTRFPHLPTANRQTRVGSVLPVE